MEVTEYRDDLPTPDVDAAEVVTRFEVNQSGRDFVVGDIHGMFGHLDVLLAEIGFKTEHDRVFSVGDLVDRGPDSRAALDWLDKPWFYACRGNHEQFAIDSLDPEQHEIWVTHNGGEWWLELEAGQHERYREAFSRLPLAIEVETRSGWVGIIHADVPPFLTWDKFMVLLEKHNRDAALYALWSRNRISGSCSTNPVSGRVERVYCGHTPTRQIVQIDNVYYIDTGAAYIRDGYNEARLTLVEIHPEPHRKFEIETRRLVTCNA